MLFSIYFEQSSIGTKIISAPIQPVIFLFFWAGTANRNHRSNGGRSFLEPMLYCSKEISKNHYALSFDDSQNGVENRGEFELFWIN